MSRRYRIMIGGGVVALLVAVGGIAAAEQGGQSAEHRQNPTTTTGETTTLPPTTLAANTTPKTGSETEGTDLETESNRTAALCHALHQGSEQGQKMKALHGQAFLSLDKNLCVNVDAVGSDGDETEGTDESTGPSENSNAGGQSQGTDNPHALNGQSHKP